MRQKRTAQVSIFQPAAIDHPYADVLDVVSKMVDDHPEWLELVAADLSSNAECSIGRDGFSVDTIFRCLIVRQLRGFSYRDLEFTLGDSLTFQRFTRVDPFSTPSKSTLQALMSAIKPATLETVNVALMADAVKEKLDNGVRVRIDSTATPTHILNPMDNRLLRDSVRVLVRLLRKARNRLGREAVEYHDHQRLAKRRELAVSSSRGENRVAAYRELVACVKRTVEYIEKVKPLMASLEDKPAKKWMEKAEYFLPLIAQVIDQTERRVFNGESVPAQEKVVSLFEPHTDIIVKSRRGTEYGHKLNLTTGKSGLVFDVVIEDGNPADSAQLLPMIERHINLHGVVPKQAAADAGYASQANLKGARGLHVQDMAFHKKCGLKPTDMASSQRVYRELQRFRAGIEAGVSYLKRCFGLARCNWRGLEHFKTYVWAGVLSHNLIVFAKLKLDVAARAAQRATTARLVPT